MEEAKEMTSLDLINQEMQRLHNYVAPTYSPSNYTSMATNNPEAEWAKKQLELFRVALLREFERVELVGPSYSWTKSTCSDEP